MQTKVLSGMFWKFAERSGAQLVGFVVSIILARLLIPEDYGIVALMNIVISILNVFVDSGFGNALIQKKDVDNIDFSSVFFFNIAICLFLYLLLFFSAPYIALFYSQSEITSAIRVLGIVIVIAGVKNVQQAYVSKNLLFKKFFFATLGGTIGAAVVGIYMALMGYGVWALICQHLFNTLVDTVILWFSVKWRPQMKISFVRLKQLFLYGWKLLVSSLIAMIYGDVWQLVVGRIYSPSDLAYFNRGKQFPNLLVTNINSSIDSVLLPAMSKEQDDTSTVKAMTRRAIKTSSYILWPMLAGLGIVAEPLIRLILTEKWIFCVPYLRVFCFTCAFWTIHTANLNAIKAVGRSDIFLKMEILKTVIGLTVLFATCRMGALTMVRISSILAVISSIIHAFPNKKLLSYGYFEQMRDVLPNFFIIVIMAVITYPINYLAIPDIASLILQIICGVLVYVLCSVIFKNDNYRFVKELGLSYIKKLGGRSGK